MMATLLGFLMLGHEAPAAAYFPFPPPPPTNITVAAEQSSAGVLIGVRVRWQAMVGLQDGFLVEQWWNGTLQRTVIVGGSTMSAVAGCAYGSLTQYRVASYSPYGRTYGPTVSFTCDAFPAAPSGTTASALSSSSIQVRWQDNSSNEVEFLVYLGILGPWRFPGNTTSGIIPGLADNTLYSAKVYARSAMGVTSLPSNRADVTTFRAPIPPAPTNLVADTLSESAIALSWTDSAVGPHGREIQHSLDGVNWPAASPDYPRESYTQSADAEDVNLPPATRHYYRVRLFTSSGDSGFSNIVTTSTFAITAPPAPSGLTATATSSTIARIRFNDNSHGDANEETFLLTAICNGSVVVSEASVQTEVDVVSLAPGATCQFKVRAANRVDGDAAYSAYSNTATLTMPGGGSTSTSTQFKNNTSYPIISLVIDNVEYVPHSPLGIAPGSYFALTLTAGGHTYSAKTGFWDETNARYVLYSYPPTLVNVQASGLTTVTLSNPTIGALLTVFANNGSVGYWSGGTWEGTTPHTQAFCFRADGSYRSYRDGLLTGSGQASITIYPTPGVFGVEFLAGYVGRLDELIHSTFDMRNGPVGWEWVHYSYEQRAACP